MNNSSIILWFCMEPPQVKLVVKNLPAGDIETWVRFLGQQDPLEEGTATHSSILAWKIPWAEEPCGLQFIDRVAKSQTRLSD